MMMKMTRWLAVAMFAGLLAACGGGGGSAGTNPNGGSNGGGSNGGGSDGGSTGTVTPTLVLSLVDANDAAIANNAITSGTITYAKAKVTDSTGAAVANKLVVFNSSAALLAFQPTSGQVLTDTSGVAKVQVAPKTINTSGAETLSASASVSGKTLADSMDVQTSPAQVALSNFTAASTSLTAFQSTTVTTDVSVNGGSASATPVTVSFSASCGVFSPTSSISNSNSKASSTFQPTGCSGGTATLTASAVGATPAQTAVTVQTPTPTNLLYVSANPSIIYTSVAAFGIKQSTVTFKVVDASGAAITTPTDVRISLSSSAIAAGVQFADTGSTTPKTVSTDVNGLVSVIVKSGAVPTPLSLTATLVNNSAITASSAGLSVNSGRPSQAFFSLSSSSFNIEGWDNDGEIATITAFLADRLGQPVPAGTPVTFVTEGGQVTASCEVAIDANNKSGCTVSLQSQNFRPADGRVTLLAYAEGEEVFVDNNGNNKYDAGETFYDMGQPFLDSNENGNYDAGEQKIGSSAVAGSGIGTSACDPAYQVANVTNTCDGSWGGVRVRQSLVVAFSTNTGVVAASDTPSSLELDIVLADMHGNAMPAGSTLTANVQGGTGCSLDTTAGPIVPSKVLSTPNATVHSILLVASGVNGTCSGAKVTLKVTTPKLVQTLLGTFTMP